VAKTFAPASRWLPAALVGMLSLGLVFGLGNACGGSKNGELVGPGGGSKTGGGGSGDAGSDAGDGGADAGDAGADAGPCVPFTIPIQSAFDGCTPGGTTQGAFMTGGADAGCAATLTAGSFICSGTLAGPANAFTAQCAVAAGNLPCTSAATPGQLDCTLPDGGGICILTVCNAVSCP
jgi:hypothetical protein